MGKNKSPKISVTSRYHPLPLPRLKKDPGVPRIDLKTKQAHKSAERPTTQDANGMLVEEVTTSTLAQGIASLAAAISTNTHNSSGAYSHLPGPSPPNPPDGVGHDPTMAAHAHQFKKVLELADVVLQVLDARDPLGCRSKIVEEEIARAAGNKKMILILNKTDLVPKENVQAWLRFLRHEYPTIPFKSSTQHQKSHLSSASSKAAAKGTPHLLHLLKSIRPAHQSITVGVLGPPNVGKSSLINSIKREKVCTVGAKPGETKALKEVVVERGIRVIDSPGIVWGDLNEESGALRNIWSLEGLDDPVSAVESIVSRVPPETLMSAYNLPAFKNTTEFLVMISLARGKLGKGGTPDIPAAALIILHDWNIGKIPYFTTPPVIHPSQITSVSAQTHTDGTASAGVGPATAGLAASDPYASTSIVSGWGKSFDLDGLWKAADDDVLGGPDDSMEEVDEVGRFVPDDEDEFMDADGNDTQFDHSNSIVPTKLHQSRSPPLAIDKSSRTIPPPNPEPPANQYILPPIQPEGITQMSSENPFSRKRLREDAKRKKKRAQGKSGVDVDVLMGNNQG